MATATGSITMQYVPAELYKSATEPATPADGDMWMDTANNILKRWGRGKRGVGGCGRL